MRIIIFTTAVLGLVVAVSLRLFLWIWLLTEERKQRERIRRIANGGDGQMLQFIPGGERRRTQ